MNELGKKDGESSIEKKHYVTEKLFTEAGEDYGGKGRKKTFFVCR